MNVNPRPVSPAFESTGPVATESVPTPQKQASESTRGIAHALKQSAASEDATILVMGYSPTGGGHTGRTLNIVDMALHERTLTKGSTVVMYIPSIWDGKARPGDLNELARKLKNADINVIVAEADKSVHGFLDKATGGSDDVKIINHFAEYPARKAAGKKQVTDCLFYSGDKSVNFSRLPSISAHDLMTSIKDVFTEGEAEKKIKLDDALKKVKVLTDMDPALQKAARQIGVPDENRVDQQNHAILLEEHDDWRSRNFEPKNALLAKVLSGNGERVSHIELGAKNTLAGLGKLVSEKLEHVEGITTQTSRQRTFQIIAGILLEKGKKIDPAETFAPPAAESRDTLRPEHQEAQRRRSPARPGTPASSSSRLSSDEPRSREKKEKLAEGVMHHASIQGKDDTGKVKNIIYIYAHASTNRIARHIYGELSKGDQENKDFRSTLFVFCGKNAVEGYNAMHLAYLADADGITTAGAGTNGEFAYLQKKAGAKSRLLVFPIKGHNEQEANAAHLDRNYQYVTHRPDTEYLEEGVTAFIRATSKAAIEEERRSGDMKQFLDAVKDTETYVRQTHNLLFGNAGTDEKAVKLRSIEMAMRENPVLKANRKFLKTTFQALNAVEDRLDKKLDINGPVEIVLTKKPGAGSQLKYDSLRAFFNVLNDDAKLSAALNSEVQVNVTNLLLLPKTRTVFSDILSGATPETIQKLISGLRTDLAESVTKADQPAERIRALKVDFGVKVTTGF